MAKITTPHHSATFFSYFLLVLGCFSLFTFFTGHTYIISSSDSNNDSLKFRIKEEDYPLANNELVTKEDQQQIVPTNRLEDQKNTNSFSNDTVIQRVSCQEKLQQRKSDPVDPNAALDESPHKQIESDKVDPPFRISLYKQEYDRMRWNSIMERGAYYETGVTRQFKEILKETAPGVVLDVGMNIGWFTLYSRAMNHRVYAFDANPLMHTRVCESLQLNDWIEDGSVQTYAYGIGDAPAMLDLNLYKNPGASSFLANKVQASKNGRHHRIIHVPVITLDTFAEQQGWFTKPPQIHLFKVDVEHYESYVFRGAQHLLNSGYIENILFECSIKDVTEVANILIMIYHSGYEVHQLLDWKGKPQSNDEAILKFNDALQQKNIDSEPIQVAAAKHYNLWFKKKV